MSFYLSSTSWNIDRTSGCCGQGQPSKTDGVNQEPAFTPAHESSVSLLREPWFPMPGTMPAMALTQLPGRQYHHHGPPFELGVLFDHGNFFQLGGDILQQLPASV